jgi:hypothetical protein
VDELALDQSSVSLEEANRKVQPPLKKNVTLSVAETAGSIPSRPSPKSRRRGREQRQAENAVGAAESACTANNFFVGGHFRVTGALAPELTLDVA